VVAAGSVGAVGVRVDAPGKRQGQVRVMRR
jgi:hypothetical protein